MSQPSYDLLHEIKARCEAATPGPWEWLTDGGYRLATTHSGRIHVMRFFRKGLHDAQPGFRDDLAVVKADDLDLYKHADAQFIAHARADIPALLAHIAHLQRRYTMPCPYCDFGSGQRGMDRCQHCDGTGRMDVHVFVAQQRDAARSAAAVQKAAFEHAWYVLDSAAAGIAPKVAAIMARANVEKFIRPRESNFDDATKESASECRK